MYTAAQVYKAFLVNTVHTEFKMLNSEFKMLQNAFTFLLLIILEGVVQLPIFQFSTKHFSLLPPPPPSPNFKNKRIDQFLNLL